LGTLVLARARVESALCHILTTVEGMTARLWAVLASLDRLARQHEHDEAALADAITRHPAGSRRTPGAGPVSAGTRRRERRDRPAVSGFEMFSLAGDAAVAHVLAELADAARAGRLTRSELPVQLIEGLLACAGKHPEVGDSAVREAVVEKIDQLTVELRWQPVDWRAVTW
jgi:hypothetical protein